MPEIPDLTVYTEAINERLSGSVFERAMIASPFLLRTVQPSMDQFVGLKLLGCERMAKQLVFRFESEYAWVVHLMISGRFQFAEDFKPPAKRNGLAAFEFSAGTLQFTEASKKKRASLKLVQGAEQLAALNPGGLEVQNISLNEFVQQLSHANHTVKRTLTDQRIFAGIGNAYSDEILLRARLSPYKQSSKLTEQEATQLFDACRSVLEDCLYGERRARSRISSE